MEVSRARIKADLTMFLSMAIRPIPLTFKSPTENPRSIWGHNSPATTIQKPAATAWTLPSIPDQPTHRIHPSSKPRRPRSNHLRPRPQRRRSEPPFSGLLDPYRPRGTRRNLRLRAVCPWHQLCHQCQRQRKFHPTIKRRSQRTTQIGMCTVATTLTWTTTINGTHVLT